MQDEELHFRRLQRVRARSTLPLAGGVGFVAEYEKLVEMLQ